MNRISPLICALALLLAAFTGAVAGSVSARLTCGEPLTTAPEPAADSPAFGVQSRNPTVFTALHVTDGLSGEGGLSVSGDVELGDTALAANGTQIKLTDAAQTVELGNTDVGVSLVVDAATSRLNAPLLTLAARRPVISATADDTLLSTDTNAIATNIGATGAITYTLPGAAAGIDLCFYVAAAQELQVKPASGDQIHALTAAAGNKLVADAAGEYLCILAADSTNWLPYAKSGTWTDTP